jgi:hypothetical protein
MSTLGILRDLPRALHIDCLTHSAIDLQRAGSWKYAEDASTEVRCVSYALGDGPISHWHPDEPVSVEIVAHVGAGMPIFAYRASFERAIWLRVLMARYGWPQPGWSSSIAQLLWRAGWLFLTRLMRPPGY